MSRVAPTYHELAKLVVELTEKNIALHEDGSPSLIDELVRAANAWLMRAKEASWAPIATAPHDGTRVLLWSPDWHGVLVGDARNADHPAASSRPTHWQPLPEPPKEPT